MLNGILSDELRVKLKCIIVTCHSRHPVSMAGGCADISVPLTPDAGCDWEQLSRTYGCSAASTFNLP